MCGSLWNWDTLPGAQEPAGAFTPAGRESGVAQLSTGTGCRVRPEEYLLAPVCLGLKNSETEGGEVPSCIDGASRIGFAADLIKLCLTIKIFLSIFSQHFNVLSSLSLHLFNEIRILKSSFMEV